jgi:outer membrane protein assembly factor BamA
VKLEGNIEYRFNVIKVLNAALFVDAGNVWLRKKYDSHPKGEFSWTTSIKDNTESFFPQIAVGAGMGFRIDFSFFIIRLDAAFKLKDPALPRGNRWTLGKQPLNDIVWNFGIGYPF